MNFWAPAVLPLKESPYGYFIKRKYIMSLFLNFNWMQS